MKNEELFFALGFIALYIPASLVIWLKTKGSFLDFVVAMIIGVFFVFAYLVTSLILYKVKRPKRKVNKKLNEDFIKYAGFRILFSDKTSGGGSI